MLRAALAWFLDVADATDRDVPRYSAKNIAIEAFTIHARILMVFLGWSAREAKGPHPEEVIAEDYLPNWKPAERPSVVEVLRMVRQRVNVQVAHLSYARVGTSEASAQWDMGAIHAVIEAEMTRFLRQVQATNSALLDRPWGELSSG